VRADAGTRISGEMGNLHRRPKTKSPLFGWREKGECSITLYPIKKGRAAQVTWMAISYAIFCLSATGGLIGVAARGGRTWTISAVILFWVMAILAFVQRAVNGI
jgi:hypothetical protein